MKRLRNYLWARWLRRHGIKLSNGPRALSKGAKLELEVPVALGDAEINVRYLRVGAHTYMRGGHLLMVGSIGRFCSIGQDVVIGQDPHGPPPDWLSTHPALFDGQGSSQAYNSPWLDVEIGHDVWIGKEAIIMKGVRVGHGAIVAARAVVTRDVPPYAIVAGMPAKVLRYRFAPDIIERLLASHWWSLPLDALQTLPLNNPAACLDALDAMQQPAVATYSCVQVTRSGCRLVGR